MSHIKRQYEFLADKVTNAIYDECFDMPDYLDSTKAEVYESIWTAILEDHMSQVYDYMFDRFTDDDDMPMTAEALAIMEEAEEMRLI